jgi:hypothetical protein
MIVVAWGDFTEASVSCQGLVKLIASSAATSPVFFQMFAGNFHRAERNTKIKDLTLR